MSRYFWASRCVRVLLPAALWILLGVSVEGASITNRNLETWSSGHPTGWTTQGLVQSMTSWTFEPQILPAQGTYSAALSTNLQAGDQYDSGFDLDGNGQHELDVATMSQTFDTLAGDLTFKINFLTSDGGSYGDDIFWVKLDGVLVVRGSAPTGASPRSSWPDVSLDGVTYNGSNLGSARGQTGWLTYTFSVTQAQHSLEFGVGDQRDHPGPSILLVDAVRVPSPYVVVNPTSVTVSENGATRNSTISLQAPPNGGVIINLTADDPTQYQVNGGDSASVVLSAAHMSEAVTISAVNDNVDETNPHAGHVTTSNTQCPGDEDFDDLPVDDINVTIRDNDDPPVVTASEFVFNGGVLSDYEVATFTDTNPSETHTAVISWGDGPDTAGTVTTTLGSETVDGHVRGSHTYGVSGTYNASLTVTDHGNPPERSGSDTFNINAANVPLPVATAATDTSQSGFTANWDVSPAILGYRLDVATTGAFGATILPGYNNLDLAGTSQAVVGLTAGDRYYYRLRVYNAKYTSANSNVISAATIPPDPVAIAATSVGSYQFTANWNSSNGATSYRLDVATDNGFGTLVAGFADKDVGGGTSALVDGLAPATTYYYRLRAANSGGVSGSSNTINVLTRPAPPIATAATGMTTTTFTANWEVSTGADGYRLDVATDVGFGTLVAGFADKDVGAGTSAPVDGLAPGTSYHYRVRAANASGASEGSNVIAVITVPAAPVATAATGITATTFTATWDASTGAGSYRLDVATDGAFGTLVAGFADKDVGAGTSALVDGLSPSTTYHYRLRAVNAGGTSADSNTISALTTPAPPVATAATGVTTTTFTANWEASTGADTYRLDVATDGGFGALVAGFADKDVGGGISALVDGLASGTTYHYRVRAVNAGGTSASSNTISALTIAAAPVATAATGITSTTFTANWEASTGADGYRLDVATDGGFGAGTFVAGFADKDVGAGTSALVDGLAPSATYHYRLRAVNTGGTGADSNTISALTTPAPPVATAAIGMTTTAFTATWAASTGADGYWLDVATDSGFGALVAGFADRDVGAGTSALVDGLTPGTTYHYRVRAASASGASDNSNVIAVITVPAAPVATAATGATATTFTANWDASTGTSSYRLDVATDEGFGSLLAAFADKDVGTGTSAFVDGLSPGTTYHLRVRARNENGTSGDSNTVNALTTPAPPVATEATAVTMWSFTANWEATAGATCYHLDIATDNGFVGMLPGQADREVGTDTSANVAGLAVGTTYYYRVRARNGCGASLCSNIIEVQTNTPIPALDLVGLLALAVLLAFLGLIALRSRT